MLQVIAKAYEVDYMVVAFIDKDIPEWCLILWTGDIIGEITKIMREVAEIHEKKVSDLVLHDPPMLPELILPNLLGF